MYARIGSDEFRVLRLEPGTSSDPLRGILVREKLEGCSIVYDALSYVWGARLSLEPLQLDSHPVRVTAGLNEALRHLRHATEMRYIWVDALCINQNDNEETSHQVSVMRDIYRNARKVEVWLGTSNESSSVGMEILAFLAGDENLLYDNPWSRQPPELCIAGLNDVLHRPYFERAWVVQENVIARCVRMWSGTDSFQWSSEETVRFLNRLKYAEITPTWREAGLSTVDMRPLIEVVELSALKIHRMRREIGLIDIVHSMRHRKATDARDMVYAMVGLIDEDALLDIDYTCRTSELYQRLLEHFEY